VKGVLGVSAVAALFAALAVQAQTGAGAATGSAGTGQSTSGQSGAGQTTPSQSASGQPTGSGQGATGTSSRGHSGTGQSGSSQTAGQSGAQNGNEGSGQASSQAGGQSSGQAGSSTASGAGTASGSLGRSDQKMVKDMAMANMAEIEASRMAQTKSQSEQVKNFAQQMIDDHTKALNEVQQLAQAKGVTLPTELDRTHKRQAQRLSALSGTAFDKAYMNQAGLADHKKTHALLTQAQARAKDPDVKALAARTMPIVDQHLNSAQQMHHTARGSSKTQGTTGSSPDKR
jgi:predicted outer membrane protein